MKLICLKGNNDNDLLQSGEGEGIRLAGFFASGSGIQGFDFALFLFIHL
jgi:hypothetical protein